METEHGSGTRQKGRAAVAATPTWGQLRRLEFIETRVFWEGRLNRSDLIAMFNISLPQASLDLARYFEIAPGNLVYDRQQKAYTAATGFRPKIIKPDSEKYLKELLLPRDSSFTGWSPPVGSVPHPSRRVAIPVLRQVFCAIHERKVLHLRYQSFTRPEPTDRAISPHAVGHDGSRWHVRAFCHEHNDFRDFVFARILKIRRSEISTIDSSRDEQWHKQISLIIAPHPDLSEGQKKALALDYGMKRGRVVLRTRQALAFYLARQLRIDQPTGSPIKQQIVLLNRKEIESYLSHNA